MKFLCLCLHLTLLLFPAMALSQDVVPVLKCSNLHKMSDPDFQQGDEVFLHLLWKPTENSLQARLDQLAKTEIFNIDSPRFQKPADSWLSGTGISEDGGITYLFRFTYLGGTTWGGYYDNALTSGEEMICSETDDFQKFLDSNQ